MENIRNLEPELPFLARPDLEVHTVSFRDEESVVVKDPVRLKYFRLTPEQYLLVSLLRVPRSIVYLKRELQKNFPSIHVEAAEVQALLQDLHTKGLILSNRVGQSLRLVLKRSEQTKKDLLRAVANPLFIRLPGWDPNAMLGGLVRYFGWLLHPLMIFACLMFVASCVTFAISHYDDVRRRLPEFDQFFSGGNLIYLWMTLAVTKLVHEIGHGMVCRKLGGECREMGLVFLVFSPTMYCNTSDSWRFDNRWHRIAVGAAGMYFELILASVCIVIWWNVPQGALQNMCLDIFFVSTVSTLIFNANPLLKFDGYYILSDFLEIPNMQAKGTHVFRSAVAWNCFGIRVPRSAFEPKTGQFAFVSYTLLAAVYRWVIFLGILGFMYHLLKPYHLEMTGMGLACISMLASSYAQGKQWYEIFSAPRKDPMNKTRIAISIVILAALLACVMLVPIPWYIEAMCYAQPQRTANVFATTGGILENILTRPGASVEKGQLLFQLKNDDLVDRAEELAAELEMAFKQQEIARSIDDSHAARVADEREKAIRKELEEVRNWLAETSVSAPVAGKIVAPATRLAEDLDDVAKLSKWIGTPLEQSNLGAFIDTQTHLCSIAPTTQFDVVMLVEQEDARHVVAGTQVRIKLYGLADRVVVSQIEDVGKRAVFDCPPELCTTFGGSIAANPAADGTFTLARGMVQARARIDIPAGHLRTGFRGSARILVHQYSIGSWVWQWLVTKIWFRI